MDKTALWDRLCKTDPAHTKAFKRAGGFSGTAIKPIWSVHRMTEEFGPCGVGWGINEPLFQVVHGSEEVLVYCTVSIWHGARENTIFGVGGDKVVGKNKYGPFTDDEAFKKAFTDAVSNAMKYIGVGGDVHMGLFDDSKYITALKSEFSEPKRENPHTTKPEDIYDEISDDIKPSSSVKKLLVRESRPLYESLMKEMLRIQDATELYEWGQAKADEIRALSGAWPTHFRGQYTDYMKSLKPITNGKGA